MAKIGLVMEGGAMRGMFTCGVIDVLMEEGIIFDGAIGVSAGATFGCNYKSHQIGRALRYNLKYCHDKRYGTFYSVRKYGDMYEKDFCYREIPMVLDPIDIKTYYSNPMEFYVVMTDCESGDPVYQKIDVINEKTMEYFRAGASMPIVSTPVEIDGKRYLDGGISDSIPLKRFMEMGYPFNVVVLTQPKGFAKKKFSSLMLHLKGVRKYKNIQAALRRRHIMYNEETKFVFEQEELGNAFIIAPTEPLGISHTEHDENELKRVYEAGRKVAQNRLADLKKFIEDRITR